MKDMIFFLKILLRKILFSPV